MVVIYYILLIFILSYSFYFIITGLFAFFKNKDLKITFPPKYHFAILIPCRNEQKVIRNLIISLKKQKYPKELFTIYVIPNNCTDNTAEIALKNGAKIIKVNQKVNSKGEALKIAFNKLIKTKKIDAFVIFDADNVVHPLFLQEMNNILNSGFQVAQGCRDSKNATDNWLSGSYSCFYWLQNYFFNKSRQFLEASALINGTGFMIKKEVIQKYGFNPTTLTEDVEFSAMCALNGIKIAYAEQAITYDEQPTKMLDSYKQRKRWTKGNYECLKKYNILLLKEFIKNKNMACLDMFLNFLAPLFQIVSLILIIILIGFKVSNITLNDPFSNLMAYNFLFFIFTFLIGLLISAGVTRYHQQKPKKVFWGIMLFGFFMLSWIPINIICLFQKNISWEEISHNRNINFQNLINKN